MEPRIRDEIGAIAVLAFALLSTVALATDQGAVLQWWRSALFALLGWAACPGPRPSAAPPRGPGSGSTPPEPGRPIPGGASVAVAPQGLTPHSGRADVAADAAGAPL